MDAIGNVIGFLDSLSRGDPRVMIDAVIALVTLVAALALARIFFLGFRTARLQHLRRLRVRLHSRINKLRADAATLRRKLGGVSPVAFSPAPVDAHGRKSKEEIRISDSVRCFFCDEIMPASALTCRHCERPNIRKLEEFVAAENGAPQKVEKQHA
ncbi:MAG: hypothetical protein KIT00_01875 [Rhodospirillales bacterium]|nr:hypothetical protein [Rhodospirillales bacterium]